MKRRLTAAFALGFAISQFAAGQEAAAPKFSSQTNLVLVPVQVRSHGRHVPGLKQDGFTLLQDGKPKKIAVFEEVRTTTQRLERAPIGPKEFTNELVGSPKTARYTVVAIDLMNTSSVDLIRVREGLNKFLSHTADTGEPIRLLSIEGDGIRVLQDFTNDPKLLLAALNRGVPSAKKVTDSSVGFDEFRMMVATALSDAGGNDPALARLLEALDNSKESQNRQQTLQERVTRINSLEALQQVALSLAGLPGRKSLVWASSGYPFASIVKQQKGGSKYDLTQVSEALALDAYTTHLLSNANIAVYPVDARGLTNVAWDAIDPSHKYSPSGGEKIARRDENNDVLATFDNLASGTGGKPCYNRADLSDCFKEAMDDSRDYYMVGFYVDGKNTKEGWHKLQIKVSEKGASVRSRDGFLFMKSDPEKTREQEISTAAQSLLLNSGLPFKGEWTSTRVKGDKIANGFVIRVAPEANLIDAGEHKLNLDVVAIARDKDGNVAGRFAHRVERTLPDDSVAIILREGLSYKNALDLPPGVFLVRIVVRDNNSGRTGAVNTLIKVERIYAEPIKSESP